MDDIKVLSVSRCKYQFENEVREHSHEFYHLLLFVGGCGEIALNGEEQSISVNDLFIMYPGAIHRFVSDNSNPLSSIEVKFNISNKMLIEEASKHLPARLKNCNGGIRQALEGMLDEAVNKKKYYEAIITANMMSILYFIMRFNVQGSHDSYSFVSLVDNEPAFNDDERMLAFNVRKYLENNYHKTIRMHSLSEHFMINQTDLYRVFKWQYGISPIQYINDFRLKMVKELLKYSTLSITEIANKTGFYSVHYMSSYFSKVEEITPSKFRQKYCESIRANLYEEPDPNK